MTRAIPYLIGFVACLLAYAVVVSVDRFLRECREKLARDREPDGSGCQVQGVDVHEHGNAR